MKYFSIFALLMVVFVAYSSAQSCPGRPRNPTCREPRDQGHRTIGCTRRNMWYYSLINRRCHEFRYLGCGGNSNRHCTRAACERACRR